MIIVTLPKRLIQLTEEFLPIEEMIHSENNDIDVSCKYTNCIIQNKPTIMSEGLKVNNIATIIDNDMKIKKKPKSIPESLFANYMTTVSSVKKYKSSLEEIPSADTLIKKSLKCPYPNCEFETSRKNYLDSHIQSHTSCKHCGEVFPGKKTIYLRI